MSVYTVNSLLAIAIIWKKAAMKVEANPPSPVTPTTASGEAKTPQTSAETREVDAKVFESVGENMKKKAGLLLDHLKKSKVVNGMLKAKSVIEGERSPILISSI